MSPTIRTAIALIRARHGHKPGPYLAGQCAQCLIGSTIWHSHHAGNGTVAALYNWALRHAPDATAHYLAFVTSPFHTCPNTTTVAKRW